MILIFDIDRSLSSIGDRKTIRNTFGADPIRLDQNYVLEYENKKGDKVKRSGMDEHLKSYLSKMFSKQMVTVRNELFDTEYEEVQTVMRDKAKKMGLRGIVIDTISGLGDAVRNTLVRESRFTAMSMDLYGKYGQRMANLITALRDIPTQVFINVHIDRPNEDDDGIEYPGVKGGQKTDMLKSFDVVVFTRIIKGRYLWQVTPTDQRPFIRSRLTIPEWDEAAKQVTENQDAAYVEQDFMPVLRAYYNASTPLKMLICGDSGTGKTKALQTMADYVQATKANPEPAEQSKEPVPATNGNTA